MLRARVANLELGTKLILLFFHERNHGRTCLRIRFVMQLQSEPNYIALEFRFEFEVSDVGNRRKKDCERGMGMGTQSSRAAEDEGATI